MINHKDAVFFLHIMSYKNGSPFYFQVINQEENLDMIVFLVDMNNMQ